MKVTKLMKTKTTTRCHSTGGALCAAAVLLLAASALAQDGFVDHHRGGEFDGVPPFASRLSQNLFVVNLPAVGSGQILEYTPGGTQSTFASALNDPRALAFDTAGNLFESDGNSGFIYKFTRGGAQTTFANVGQFGPEGGMAFDRAGNLLVANFWNGNIYAITPGGVQSTFASGLGYIDALAFDRAGNLFAGGQGSPGIYKITPGGVASTFATGLYPEGLAFDRAGNLFATDEGTFNIIKITPEGVQSTFASGLEQPLSLAFSRAGNLFVSAAGNLYEFTPDGTPFYFATGLNQPTALAFAPRSGRTQTVYVGNPALPFVNYAQPDGVPPLVILGEYSPTGPLPATTQPLPDGMVQDVKFYGQDYDFTLYALARVATRSAINEQTFRVVAAQHFSGTSPTPGTITLAVTNFRVCAGDFLAFAGTGPFYPQQPNDAANTDATYENSSQPVGYDNDTAAPPLLDERFTVGINRDSRATYGYLADNFGNQGRIYALGVDVLIDK